MRLSWFRRNGIFFIPISLTGWIITIAVIAFSVYTFVNVDRKSHSVSDTLMNFAFCLLIIAAVYSLIAYLTSRSREE